MSDALEDATHEATPVATPDATHDEATPAPHEVSATTGGPTLEAPGGPKRAAKGPRAVRGPATGFAASLALMALLVIVIAWTRC